MYLEGLVWSNKQGTDGHIPRHAVRRVTDEEDPIGAAAELVDAGLWEETGDDWSIVGFLEDQPSRADVERIQTLARDRQRRQRQHRGGDHSLCDPRYCQAASRVTNAVTHDTRTDPSVPTRTEGTEGRGGGAAPSGAYAPTGRANRDVSRDRSRLKEPRIMNYDPAKLEGVTPFDIAIDVNDYSDRHHDVSAWPIVTLHQCHDYSRAEVVAGNEWFARVAQLVHDEFGGLDHVAGKHGCRNAEDGTCGMTLNVEKGESEPLLTLTIPADATDVWGGQYLRNALAKAAKEADAE
jgi:hypothetical protein